MTKELKYSHWTCASLSLFVLILCWPLCLPAPQYYYIIRVSNVLTISVPDTPLTQWRLFQKRCMRNKLDIYVFINLLHYIYNQTYFPYCVVFVLFILCVQCCQFLWTVHSWLPLRFSLTFIQTRYYFLDGVNLVR